MRAIGRALFAWAVAAGAMAGVGPETNSFGVAYTRCDGDGHWQVFLAEPRGGAERQATASAWDKRALRAANGSSVLHLRDNQGRLFSLDTRLPAPEPEPVAIDLGTANFFDIDPRRGLLVSAYAQNAVDNLQIWWIAPGGGEQRLVIPGPHLNDSPRWMDDDRFVFIKTHKGRSALYVSPVREPAPELFLPQVLVSTVDPAPSPDGSTVAFCRQSPDTGLDLCVADCATRQARVVYAGPSLEAEPAWSPDGRWIYFVSWDGGNLRIARVGADGSGFAWVSPEGADGRTPACVGGAGP